MLLALERPRYARPSLWRAGQFTRKWLINARRSDEIWKVSNFEEFD